MSDDFPTAEQLTDDHAAEILAFWEAARHRAGVMRTSVVTGMGVSGTMVPPTWSFGDDPKGSEHLLDLVLSGEKTATSTALAEFESADEPLPVKGDLSIVLDAVGQPRALIRITAVATVPFDQVSADHAAAEGEGDRTLEDWRVAHERFWRRVLGPSGVEFTEDLLVVTERFELLYPRVGDR